MTVFLTPDGRPFYGGTYFPPERSAARHARPSAHVLDGVAEAYRERRDAGRAPGADADRDGLRQRRRARPPRRRLRPRRRTTRSTRCASLTRAHSTTRRTAASGGAPKFPTADDLRLPAAHHARSRRAAEALAMGDRTLDAMAARRHPRPARRRLPPLRGRRALARAALREDALRQRAARARRTSRRTRRPATRSTARVTPKRPRLRAARDDARRTAASTPRQDADTEGDEGKFYVWTPDELRARSRPGGRRPRRPSCWT